MGAGAGGARQLVEQSMGFAKVMLEHFTTCGHEVGLPKQQAFALHLLAHQPPLTMSALADLLGTDASTVTGLVDRLEARGLIGRHVDPEDRRVKHLTVTEAGAATEARLASQMFAQSPVVRCLSRAEQVQLAGLLAKVTSSEGCPLRPGE